MNRYALLLSAMLTFAASNVQAELEVYKDYDLGTSILEVTTVKVDPNMGDVYLEGLRDTWVKAVKMQKELGYIKDWKIYASDLPISGDFNLVLVVWFENAADLEPNKEKYQAFMKKWGEENQENSRKISKEYPKIRSLTGQYRMREVIMK
ncbi:MULTISPECIES: hypothetical protein [unclassified Pseudoalteromonas]|uniref:hypothetical protein n=1 Tax=unclassified Pseudoalteromonas TaxID=194690 RepID=UPI000CF72C6B|nr:MULTISPECIES: hypothetical protein [unclassified Pseudoalteromonas]